MLTARARPHLLVAVAATLTLGAADRALAQSLPPVSGKPIEVAVIRPNADARVQSNVATNFANGDLIVGNPDKVAFLHFPVKAELPVGAAIVSAELTMSFRTLSNGSNPVDIGKVQGAWQESAVNAVNQPPVNWKNAPRTVTPGSKVSYDVTGAVASWLKGDPNQGLALRGDGPLMYGYSRETAPSAGDQPTLRIRYVRP